MTCLAAQTAGRRTEAHTQADTRAPRPERPSGQPGAGISTEKRRAGTSLRAGSREKGNVVVGQAVQQPLNLQQVSAGGEQGQEVT